MKRRQFIQLSSLASTAPLMPGFLSGWPHHLPSMPGKKLVVIQLSGGNDGLNTLIPFRQDAYYKARPGIGIERDKLLAIDDASGFHPALGGFAQLLEKGWLSVVNAVGYPNPDRSHFRSMDIWQSGSGANQTWNTGWLGRALDAQCTEDCPAHWALEVNESLSLALKGANKSGFALKNPLRLERTMRKLPDDNWQASSKHGIDELDFIIKTFTETKASAAYLAEKARMGKPTLSYPQHEIGKNLATIASLMLGGAESRVYYASMSGFDTHIRQSLQHQMLLKNLGDAVWAFSQELHKANMLKDTVIMIFSEFGRRVKQNASGGTDHGTANNVYIVSEKINKAGHFNELISLNELWDGDLIHRVDFRSIYANLLEQVLEQDSKHILGNTFTPLALI